MIRVYLGRPGSGKTTKLLKDLKKLKCGKIAIFSEESEVKKYEQVAPNAAFFTREDIKKCSL